MKCDISQKLFLGFCGLFPCQFMPSWWKPLSSGIYTLGFAKVAGLSKVVIFIFVGGMCVYERRLASDTFL